MYLSIILTIFVVLQIVTIVLVYKWWKKYGRELFKTFKSFNQSFPKTNFSSPTSNPFGQIPDMGEMMKQLNDMTKKMGKTK
jgi:hypothetical protein